MTAEQFSEWRARLGLSVKDAADALGIGRNQPTLYENGTWPIKKTVALACAAVAMNLKPYGDQ